MLNIVHLCAYAVRSGPLPGALGLARAQAALGHNVWFAYDRFRGPFSPYEEAFDPHLEPLPGHGAPPVPLALAPKGGPWRFVADLTRLRGWLRAARIAVVHAHLSHDHLLARLAAPPRAARIRTVHAERATRRRPLAAWLFRGTDACLVRRSAHREALTAHFGARWQRDATAIAGGIDVDFWCRPHDAAVAAVRQQVRGRLRLPPAAPLLVHAALFAGRGQVELIDALSHLAQTGRPVPHAILVGLGPDREGVGAHAAQSPAAPYVHFWGYADASALREVYTAADAAWVARPGNDGAARAALEAMAMALPVLAPADRHVLPAVPELADEAASYLADSLAPTDLADAIVRWHRAGDGPARGQQGRQRVAAHRSFVREAQETDVCYQRALELRAAAR